METRLLGVAIRSSRMVPAGVSVFDNEYDRDAMYPGYEVQDDATHKTLGFIWTDEKLWCWKVANCGKRGDGWGRCETKAQAVENILAAER